MASSSDGDDDRRRRLRRYSTNFCYSDTPGPRNEIEITKSPYCMNMHESASRSESPRLASPLLGTDRAPISPCYDYYISIVSVRRARERPSVYMCIYVRVGDSFFFPSSIMTRPMTLLNGIAPSLMSRRFSHFTVICLIPLARARACDGLVRIIKLNERARLRASGHRFLHGSPYAFPGVVKPRARSPHFTAIDDDSPVATRAVVRKRARRKVVPVFRESEGGWRGEAPPLAILSSSRKLNRARYRRVPDLPAIYSR